MGFITFCFLLALIAETVSNEDKQNYTTIFFLVGLEGTGHHAMVPLLEDLAASLNLQMVVIGYTKHNSLTYKDKELREYLRLWKSDDVKEHVKNIELKAKRQGKNGVLILLKHSFPGGNFRRTDLNATNYHDIINSYPFYNIKWLSSVFAANRLKALWMTRNFEDAVFSHENWDGGYDRHAHVLGMYFDHITSSLQTTIFKDNYVCFDYRELALGVDRIAHSLQNFLGFGDLKRSGSLPTKLVISTRNSTNDQSASQLLNVLKVKKQYNIQPPPEDRLLVHKFPSNIGNTPPSEHH
eukprot:m.112621 g.112621  ORF g.112621 m.112621 type:complete len:296 (-) comp14094_c1_seq5:25-912(-)